MPTTKPKVAVHKFSSCDGCQLAFLNMGEDLLALFEQVDIVHFAEAGPINLCDAVDISFVEGSLATPDDIHRIDAIRKNSRYIVTIGACATAGGLQALRNIARQDDWMASIYTTPGYIASLERVMPIHEQIKVDFELHGCPVSTRQITAVLRALLNNVTPVIEQDKVCMACKRRHTVCVMVARGLPCMGPVTQTGCGALCPDVGRDCYGCHGSAENANTTALGERLRSLHLDRDRIRHRFVSFTGADPVFARAGSMHRENDD